MIFGVISNPKLRGTLEISKTVIELLRSREQDFTVEEKLAESLGMTGAALEEMAADIIITIGGDGTVLRTLQRASGRILAVNMGKVGFLTEIVPEDTSWELTVNVPEDALKRIKMSEFISDEALRDIPVFLDSIRSQ